MRVLLVSGSYPPMKCGVGDYTHRLAHALANTGEMEVAILTSRAAESASPSPVQVLAQMPSWSIGAALHAARVVLTWKPDLVHVQYPTQGYGRGRLATAFPMIVRLLGGKIVQTWHESTGLRGAASFLLRTSVASKIIVVRPGFREALHPLLRAMLISRAPVFIPNASSIARSALTVEERRLCKQAYLANQQRLIVFFGFVYPFKGVDLLFEIADPSTDRVIVAGDLDRNSDYGRHLLHIAESAPWTGKVAFPGFLTPEKAADLLSISDAVILPFRRGGGEWNSSIHAAVANGAYVITTSERRRGFDAQHGIHYSAIDDVVDMRHALALAARRKPPSTNDSSPVVEGHSWQSIAMAHLGVYRSIVAKSQSFG